MRIRPLYQIASTVALTVVTLGNSALADVKGLATALKASSYPAQPSLASTIVGTGKAPASQSLVAARSNVTRIFTDEDGPRIRRSDGQEFRLMPLPEELKRKLESDAAKPTLSAQSAGAEAMSLFPNVNLDLSVLLNSKVDNRRFHGPIRNQGGRGTCVSFSTTAAVEGAYRRLDPTRYRDLDLSEQWACHMNNIVRLAPGGAGYVSWTENRLGAAGGSECTWLMRVLQKYGLPEEGAMAYQWTEAYGPAPEPNDPTYQLQRNTDTFNLDPNALPITALGKSPYAPVWIENLTYDQARDTSRLEDLVWQGYDVVFDISLVTPEGRTADGAWTPGADAKSRGGHSMLIVGYNRFKQYFIVRNSWGHDSADGGYTRVSYDYVRNWAYSGCYVRTVVAGDVPTATTPANKYIGRWKMNHDGWPGTLDIYRLPGLYRSNELKGQADYRIGTYFDRNGNAYRVNGYLWGSDLVFFINFRIRGPMDLDVPSAPYGSLDGTRFVGQLFSWDDQNLAGLEVQDGVTYSFHATKETTPWHVAAPWSANPRDAFLGYWRMNHDGWKGEMYLYPSGSNGVAGWYRIGDGNWVQVTGFVSGRNFRFWIWFGFWQEFNGYIYSWDKGVMSGVTYWGGTDFGFTAVRQG